MKHASYVLLHRAVFENPVFQNHFEAMAFMYLVAKAAWSPMRVRYKGKEAVLQRGQVAISVRDFAERMGKDRGWAHRFLLRLASRDMIVTATVTGVNVISICNYDKYQFSVGDTVTASEQQPGQHRDSTVTQKKEEKELKKEDTPYSPPARKRATTWRDGDKPPVEWLRWAQENKGWTPRQALAEAERFIDYCLARGKSYLDWQAAWRQWCRSSYQKTVSERQQPLSL